MEPITMIVTALALGAAAGIQGIAEQAIKDGYEQLKALVQRKYAGISLKKLEGKPDSKARRGLVEEELAETDAAQDEEALRQAQALLDAIYTYGPAAAAIVGVDLQDIKGASLEIEDIVSRGAGVKVRQADVGGPIKIKGVRAGGGQDPNAGGQ